MKNDEEKNKALRAIDESGVRAGQSWQHFRGGRYSIIATGVNEATLTPVVVYAGHDGVVWVRPLTSFLDKVDAGSEVPRFKRIDDEVVATAPFERSEPIASTWRPTDEVHS